LNVPSVSVVVPVYRSESSLLELTRRLHATFATYPSPVEIILVEDDGGDGCWALICELARADGRVRGFRHSRNYGQHNALLTGIRQARHEVIVTLDDDLQNPPEEIPKLLAELARGHDAVYGTPIREQHGLFRDFASKVTKIALQGAMGARTARKVSAFRAFRTDLRAAFADYNNPNVQIDVLLTWGTTRFGAVVVQHDPRTLGASNYTIRKLVRHAMNMATGYSVVPLKVASLIGFVFTLFGMGLLVYVVGGYFIRGTTVAGFPFLASIIALFSGAQMFALGIIGEYLARIHLRSMGQPAAILRDRTPAGAEVRRSIA
jgi:glycosyltransferase involved in cell wall biosynthesis